jgi:hypothetical protein
MRAEIEKLRGVYLLQDGKTISRLYVKANHPIAAKGKAKMAAGTEEKHVPSGSGFLLYA